MLNRPNLATTEDSSRDLMNSLEFPNSLKTYKDSETLIIWLWGFLVVFFPGEIVKLVFSRYSDSSYCSVDLSIV